MPFCALNHKISSGNNVALKNVLYRARNKYYGLRKEKRKNQKSLCWSALLRGVDVLIKFVLDFFSIVSKIDN